MTIKTGNKRHRDQADIREVVADIIKRREKMLKELAKR